MVQITIVGEQLDALKKKYPGVDWKRIDKFIIGKCMKYNKVPEDKLSSYGFEYGGKQEFIEQIKEFITLRDFDYVGEVKEIAKKVELEFYTDKDLMGITFPEPEWIIQGLIPLGDVGLLAGKRGERKTFTALIQAICIASGKDFLINKTPKPRKVLFITEEDNIINLQNRIKMIKKGLNIEKQELPIGYFTMNNIKLDQSDEKDIEFRRILREFKPALIIVDTFQRCVSFDADRDNREISDFFMGFAIPISKEFTCSWLFLHHLRKGLSGAKGIEDPLDEVRGGSEIVNFARFVLGCRVPKGHDDLMVLSSLKMSHSEKIDQQVISFNHTEEEGLKVTYVGKPGDVINDSINCAQAIKKWIFENKIKEFRTKQINEAQESIGYKKSMLIQGLKYLKDIGYLVSVKRGYYEVNMEEIIQQKL